jgi:hypothetical protein
MATIGAAVDDATKERFKAEAAARVMTESRLAAAVIVQFLSGDLALTQAAGQGVIVPPPVAPPAQAEAKTEQVFVRLQPYYYDELGRLASARKWYRGTYLANMLYAHVDRRPVLCQDEIDAVRQVARQLADVGRNINQIAKKLNSSPKETHHAFALDLDLLNMMLDLEMTTLKELLRANMRGWGVSDDEG